ncbi:uncharacterized protein LOC132639352 [Lycium barbarum]|uniref:uncharacterized protein LOC132639352 n=1 Tax=Lycium barbarum TaxID=112863 RepID=UPI00293E18FA|nr:uncharacterized protein LOC132639352 [Lycium barbarum]
MVFKDVDEFKRVVTKYAVRKRVKVEKWVNEPTRVRVRCKDVKLAKLNVDSRPIFQSFYIYFDALKKAFQHCRICIGLDGCFLKGVCRGQLLVAVCKDGNNQMLPLAWAMVEYENKSTWTWFIRILKEDLALGDGTDLTLITDMQKGLFVAIQDLLPAVEHRKCVRHILANFSKEWRGLQRRQRFWRIAKSTFESQLRRNIELMKLLGPTKMMDKLMHYNIDYWCKVYFNTNVKVDSIDNNMAECFNAWILAARHKTIITMLEEIRVKMMARIGTLREFVNTWRCNYSPMCTKVLEENAKLSMQCNIEFNGVAGFEIREGLYQHTVDISRRQCSCRVWQLKGIPCAHVLVAIQFKRYDLLGYIDHWYSKETYMRTYEHVLQPVTNMEMWPVSTHPSMAPPDIKSMPGKRQKGRRKEAGEIPKSGKMPRTGMAMTCSNCHNRGHNNRIMSTSKAKVTRSAEVTGDIGYKPSANSKLKWRANEAITTRKLQEIQEKMTKGRGKSANPSQESTCSQSKQPWKI